PGVNGALRPSMLCRAQSRDILWLLRRCQNARAISELIPRHLCAVRQVQIFCRGIVLPSPGRIDGFATPHAARSGEIEVATRTETRTIFDQMVSIQHQRLNLRQEIGVTVHVRPSSLDHPNSWVDEMINDVSQKAC